GAVHGRDDRLPQLEGLEQRHEGDPGGGEQAAVPLVLGLAGAGHEREQQLEVAARGEGLAARAGEHGHAQRGVVAELGPRVGEPAERLGRERVLRVRAVQRDPRDAVAFLEEEVGHAAQATVTRLDGGEAMALAAAVPILSVDDLPRPLDYYQRVLGFRQSWVWGEP